MGGLLLEPLLGFLLPPETAAGVTATAAVAVPAHAALLQRIPHCEAAVVPVHSHLLQSADPGSVARPVLRSCAGTRSCPERRQYPFRGGR